MLKQIVWYTCGTFGYYLLCFFSFMFIVYIWDTYLFTPPDQWSTVINGILPRLGTLYLGAFGMYLHLWAGFIIAVLSLVQILPLLRHPRLLLVHRILGNLYCLCCFFAALGGNLYIYSTGTTGGTWMDIPFSIYGFLMGICSLMTYIRARQHRVQDHSNWALRLWALGVSGINYRVLYLIFLGMGYPIGRAGFSSFLDRLITWSFFLVPLGLMEIFIHPIHPPWGDLSYF